MPAAVTGCCPGDGTAGGAGYDLPSAPARLAALREVAAETGATVNQVVLAWLLGGDVPAIPLVGASSVAQLDEASPRVAGVAQPPPALQPPRQF